MLATIAALGPRHGPLAGASQRVNGPYGDSYGTAWHFDDQKDLGIRDFQTIYNSLLDKELCPALASSLGAPPAVQSLDDWGQIYTKAPAKCFGPHTRRESLQPEAVADVVIFSPDR